MTTTTKLVEFSFSSPICLLESLNVEVLVVVVVLAVCRAPDHRFITGFHFQLLLTLPPSDTEYQKGGIRIIFNNLC